MTTPKADLSTAQIRSRNPLLLNATQEAEVREIYHKSVRSKCADEIRAFANCSKTRTLTMAWACREQRRTMNTCMLGYATRDEQDAAREKWFQTKLEKAREYTAKEQEKKDIERPMSMMVPARSSSELKTNAE